MDTQKLVAAWRAKLNGQTSKEVGQQKIHEACLWIYRWGFSTPSIIDSLSGAKSRGFSARLVSKGLLKSTLCPSYGGVKHAPAKVLTLTRSGIEVVEARADSKIVPYHDAIPFHQIVHDVLVQTITLEKIKTQQIKYFTARENRESRNQPGQKIPDAVWLIKGDIYAFELELSAKRSRELDTTCAGLINLVTNQNITGIIIYSPSNAIIDRYKESLKIGNKIDFWKRQGTRWVTESTITVPDAFLGKIIFKKIEL